MGAPEASNGVRGDVRLKILLDHNVPKYLRRLLKGHEVSTAKREGWAELVNGRLLAVAEKAGFELLVTLDQGIPQEQNLQGRRIALATLCIASQEREAFLAVFGELVALLPNIAPGTITAVPGALPDEPKAVRRVD